MDSKSKKKMIRYDEIMIGDYVLVNGTPRKVEAITKEKIGYHTSALKIGLSYSQLCECEHVKITPQWLLSNGFTADNYGNYRKIENRNILKVRLSGVMDVSIDTLEAHPAITFPYCCYLDRTLARLQQILRIHGYDKCFNIEP